MRAKTPIIVILLSLTFLMAIPSPIIRVNAAKVTSPTTWSPWGPQAERLLITVYSDFQTMFNAFNAGQVDITDWPLQPADKNPDLNNPDFAVTQAEGDIGIFELDINRAHPFFGVSFHAARAAPSPSIKSIVTSPLPGGTCAAGQNRYTVVLDNVEESNAAIKDPLNKVTIVQTPVGSPSNTVAGNAANNIYSMGCLLADNYVVRTSVYKGQGTVAATGPGLDVTITLSVAYNSNSNAKETEAGANIGRALAHFLDKPNYQNTPQLNGQTTCPDLWVVPFHGLGGNCGTVFDPNEPTFHSAGLCAASISLYNCSPDQLGCTNYWWAADGCGSPNAQVGYSGQTDLQAACEHFIAAGFTMKNGNCANLAAIAQGNTAPSCANVAAYTCPHLVIPGGKNQVIMYIRTDPRRRAFGQIIADSIQLFFGTPNDTPNNQVTTCVVNYGFNSPGAGCTPAYYGISQIGDIIFAITLAGGVPPGQDTLRDWHIYTGGYFLGSTPDHLWALGNSDFSGGTANGACAGIAQDEPDDYRIFCDPIYDTLTNAGEFAATLPEANNFFGPAAVRGAIMQQNNPAFVLSSRFVALQAWNWQPGQESSLVQQIGHGFQAGFWSLLNMRCNPNYTPVNNLYQCGGGNPELIRRGFSQDVHKLSIYHALTVWDFEVLGQIYDSLLAVDPRTGGAGAQTLDWGTTSHTQSYNPNVDSCILKSTGLDCASYVGQGTTTQIYNMRGDLKFHSGNQLTADDFCFNVLTDEYVPSANLGPSVSQVSSCKALGTLKAEVKLVNKSPFYELNVGGLPLVRALDYQAANRCNWVAAVHDSTTLTQAKILDLQASNCSDPAFDPMQLGIMNGHGPWVCKSGGGAVGGPCSSSGTQDVTLGGTIALERYEGYARCCPNVQGTSLQKESWSDKNDDGKVDILDIADAALKFGQPDEYWDSPLFGVTNGVVDIGEIATIAFYFDHGTTKPFAPSALSAIYPEIDPFHQRHSFTGTHIVGAFINGVVGGGATFHIVLFCEGTPSPNPCTFNYSLEVTWDNNVGNPVGSATFSGSQTVPSKPGKLVLTIAITGIPGTAVSADFKISGQAIQSGIATVTLVMYLVHSPP